MRIELCDHYIVALHKKLRLPSRILLDGLKDGDELISVMFDQPNPFFQQRSIPEIFTKANHRMQQLGFKSTINLMSSKSIGCICAG